VLKFYIHNLPSFHVVSICYATQKCYSYINSCLKDNLCHWLIGASYGQFSPAWVMDTWIVEWVWTKKLKGFEKRRAPYCHLWDCLTLQYFSTMINDTNFEKKSLDIKCVYWFSLRLLSETFLISRRTEQDVIKTV
jgi:hypothetical protein